MVVYREMERGEWWYIERWREGNGEMERGEWWYVERWREVVVNRQDGREVECMLLSVLDGLVCVCMCVLLYSSPQLWVSTNQPYSVSSAVFPEGSGRATHE